MEIDKTPHLVNLSAEVHRLEAQSLQQKVRRVSEENLGFGADRIELSVRSREIMHLDELIRSTPDIREDRVEQVRSALESGTYNVKAEKIADKILNGNVIDEVF